MIEKLKNIFYLLSILAFIIFTTLFYFSNENITNINKSRSINYKKLADIANNLPLLKNDTENIIEYRNDISLYKKNKKKYKFFELIKK